MAEDQPLLEVRDVSPREDDSCCKPCADCCKPCSDAATKITTSKWFKRFGLGLTVLWAYGDIILDGVNGWQLWEAKDYYWASIMVSLLFVPNFVTWAFLRANGLASSSDLAVLMFQLGPIRELTKSWKTAEPTSNMIWYLVAEGLGEAPFSAVLNGYIVTFGAHGASWTHLATFYAGFFWSLVTVTKAAVKLHFYGRINVPTSEMIMEWIWRFPMIAMRLSSLVCFGYLMRSTCDLNDDLTKATEIALFAAGALSFGTLLAIIYAVEPSVSFSVCTYFATSMLFTTPMGFLGAFKRIHDSVYNLRIAETIMLATLAANPMDPNPRVPKLWENAPIMVATFVLSFGVVILTRFLDFVYQRCSKMCGKKEETSEDGDFNQHASHRAESLDERANKVKQQLHCAIDDGDLMMVSLLCKIEGANLQDPVVILKAPNSFDEEYLHKLEHMGMPKDLKALKETATELLVGELKHAGCPLEQILELDYNLAEVGNAGFTLEQMREEGVTLERKKADMPEVTHEELLEAGYSKEELENAGIHVMTEKKALSKSVAQKGDEVVCLPGVTFDLDGKHYYRGGDKGRICSTPYIDDKGKERFEIVWYRTYQISSMTSEAWLVYFRYIGKGVDMVVEGDEIMALSDLTVEGEEYYVPGDKGKVSKNAYLDETDNNIEKFEVTWDRTKLVSTMKTESWYKYLRAIGNKDQNKTVDELEVELEELKELLEHGGPVSNAPDKKELGIGDEVQALPGIEFKDASGKVYYKAGDLGRVSKDIYIDEKDSISRFEVTWYRTGLTSTMKQEVWQKNFKFTGSALPVPTKGYEMQALPGISLVVEGQEYYAAGDRGRVSKNSKVDEKDGIERFEVTWYRTGLTSTMKVAFWARNFKIVDAV